MKVIKLSACLFLAALLCCSCAIAETMPSLPLGLGPTACELKLMPLASLDESDIDFNKLPGGRSVLARGDNKTYSADEIALLDSTRRGYGQGLAVNAENRPTGALSMQDTYGKYAVRFIMDSGDNNIFLTFDEGYENGYTPLILDTLLEKGVRAVFFVTYDYARSQPDLIRRMIDEGHVVGNHSVNHYSMPTLEYEECISEIVELHNYVLENFDYEMYLFRPPMGEFSEKSLAITESLGYTTVLWSFAYPDWDPANQPQHEAALERICDAAHDGAVYLLHAVSKTNTEILGQVIDSFIEKGYTLNLF